MIFATVQCPYERKLLVKEKEFLHDQRTNRRMQFSHIGKKTTKKQQRNLKLNNKQVLTHQQETYTQSERRLLKRVVNDLKSPPKKIKLTNTAAVLNAKGISHRAGAVLINAYMKDQNDDNNEQLESDIVDPSKLYREKKKIAKKATEVQNSNVKQMIDNNDVFAVFFDGKKDSTMTSIKNNETQRNHPRIVKENHYAVVLQPGDVFYTHVTPNGNCAIDAAECIFNSLSKHGIDLTKLMFAGADGTAFNTGRWTGCL